MSESQYVDTYRTLLQNRNDPKVVDVIVRNIDPYVWKCVWQFARKYDVPEHASDDLHSESIIAVIRKAIPKYDESKGAFSTYAKFWIDEACRTWWKTHQDAVPVSDHFRKAVRNGKHVGNSHKEQIGNAIKSQKRVVSLDIPISDDGEDTWLDLLEDVSSENAEDMAVNKERLAQVRAAIDDLNYLEQQTLYMRANDNSFETIASKLGNSCAKINQLEKEAIRKVRIALNGTYTHNAANRHKI